jgi:hypothetical protein
MPETTKKKSTLTVGDLVHVPMYSISHGCTRWDIGVVVDEESYFLTETWSDHTVEAIRLYYYDSEDDRFVLGTRYVRVLRKL